MLASFLSQPVVFGTSISEVLMDVTLLTLLGGLYRHINCEQPGCRRLGHRHPDHGRPVCRKHYHHDVVPARHI